MGNLINLTIPEHAYLFGFLQGDGYLFRHPKHPGKGQLKVEVSAMDRPLLEAFQQMLPCRSSVSDRERDTNFRRSYITSVWSVSDHRLRQELATLGLPAGKKSQIIEPPSGEYSEVDYFRGLLDADGSLGLTPNGLPFLSLTTASDAIAGAYLDFLLRVIGQQKRQGRNRRDNIYNVMVWKEHAQTVAGQLYSPDCLCLHRKYRKALEVLAWVRPSGMRRVQGRKGWSPDQDEYVLSHTAEETMACLGRGRNSVVLRRRRLRRAQGRQTTE